jgi:fibronectin type 3 domain-containing protein
MRLVKLWISVIALFSVTAFGLTGCGGGGGGGTPIIPMTTAPAAPTGVAAAALNNTQVGLTWGAVTGATSYNVYWSTTAGLPKEQRTKISVAAPPFTHSNLQSGATYYYLVTAVNSAGESAPSAEVSAKTTVSPTAVSATPANAQVTLAWPEVPGATSYNVYFSTSSNMIPASSTKVPNAARTGQIITPLVNGTPYFFEVTAVINGVESDPSAIVSAVPSTTPAPAAPFVIQSSNLVFGGQSQISVAWGDVPNAASYNVYFSTTPNVSKTNFVGSFINAQTSVVNGLRTFHPTVTDQGTTTYYFIVTAVDAGGNESTASPVLKVIPPIFTQVMVSGKTVTYMDATNGAPNGKTFTFVANPNGTLTFVSTLSGVPASGTGSWAILADGSLQVLIPNGSLTFNYDIFQTTNNGNLVRVQFTNGSQTSAGDMTFS